MSTLLAGDVLRIFDPTVTPPKAKRVICVCPTRRLFLRINTRPIWRPNLLLKQTENSFLDHDSYLELNQLLLFTRSTIDQALAHRSNVLGEVSNDVAVQIVRAAWRARTLSQEQKDLIWQQLDPGCDPTRDD